MVRINSTSGLADRNIFVFPPKTIGNHISSDFTLGGEFDEDRWKIAFNSFCLTDSLTDERTVTN